MSLDSYTGLKQSIIDHLDRDDLSSQVDDFIDIAEARHKRKIRILEMLVRSPLTVVNRYTAIPAGYLGAKTFRLLTDPVTVLTSVNLHEMNIKRREVTGKPLLFTVHAEIEFDKTPDQSYSGEIVYYKSVSPLSSTQASNAILAKAPDVYLYAALAASAPFLMNDERVKLWENLYTQARDSLNQMEQSMLHVGPVVAKVSGWTP